MENDAQGDVQAIAAMDGEVFTMRAKNIFLIVLAVSFNRAISYERWLKFRNRMPQKKLVATGILVRLSEAYVSIFDFGLFRGDLFTLIPTRFDGNSTVLQWSDVRLTSTRTPTYSISLYASVSPIKIAATCI